MFVRRNVKRRDAVFDMILQRFEQRGAVLRARRTRAVRPCIVPGRLRAVYGRIGCGRSRGGGRDRLVLIGLDRTRQWFTSRSSCARGIANSIVFSCNIIVSNARAQEIIRFARCLYSVRARAENYAGFAAAAVVFGGIQSIHKELPNEGARNSFP